MGHLLDDSRDLEGEHLLHLAGNQHACNPDQMDVLGLIDILGFGQKRVHQIDRYEKCIVIAVEGGKDLDHPVDHLGPDLLVYLVLQQKGLSEGPRAGLQLVFEDRLEIPVPDFLRFLQNQSLL